jgi:hypothetical protein
LIQAGIDGNAQDPRSGTFRKTEIILKTLMKSFGKGLPQPFGAAMRAHQSHERIKLPDQRRPHHHAGAQHQRACKIIHVVRRIHPIPMTGTGALRLRSSAESKTKCNAKIPLRSLATSAALTK